MRRISNEIEIGLERFFSKHISEIFLVIIVIWLVSIGFGWCSDHLGIKPCTQAKMVKFVGGCDVFGDCGVMFTDGTLGQVRLPAHDQLVCTERSWFARKDDRVEIPERIKAL